MVRCQICNRRIEPGNLYCGDGKCVATKSQKLPKCLVCGTIAVSGEKCSGGYLNGNKVGSGGAHRVNEGEKLVTNEIRRLRVEAV